MEADVSGTGTGNGGGPLPEHADDPERGGGSESWKERGVALRVFVYVFATHLFAPVIFSSCVDTPCFSSGRKRSPCGAGLRAGILRQGGSRCRDRRFDLKLRHR
ncbi:DUF6126 family protein [Streptomyces sp. NBC_00464]